MQPFPAELEIKLNKKTPNYAMDVPCELWAEYPAM